MILTGTLATLLAGFPENLTFEPEVSPIEGGDAIPPPLSMLPDEVLVLVLCRLDSAGIERFAAVCRKARVVSLDSAIWRCVSSSSSGVFIFCLKSINILLLFPPFPSRGLIRELVNTTYRPPQVPDVESMVPVVERYLADYRRVYVEHPRVRLDGVYISVCHYMCVRSFSSLLNLPFSCNGQSTGFKRESLGQCMFPSQMKLLSSIHSRTCR